MPNDHWLLDNKLDKKNAGVTRTGEVQGFAEEKLTQWDPFDLIATRLRNNKCSLDDVRVLLQWVREKSGAKNYCTNCLHNILNCDCPDNIHIVKDLAGKENRG